MQPKNGGTHPAVGTQHAASALNVPISYRMAIYGEEHTSKISVSSMQELLQIIPKQKKFTTSSIRMKKEYSKPYLVSEVFEPQEYCAPCTKPYPSVTTLSGWSDAQYRVYIDLNGNHSYDMGEAFSTDGSAKVTSLTNQTTSGEVGIYHILVGETNPRSSDHNLRVGQEYANHNVGSNIYTVKDIGPKKITIIDTKAYIKTMS